MNVITNSDGTQTLSGANLVSSGRLIVPMGELAYFSTTGTALTISGTSDGATNMVVVDVATALSDMPYEFDMPANGRLRYTGLTAKCCHCAITMSGTPATPSDILVLGLAKDGAVVAASKVLGSASGTQFSALHCMVHLATNSYIELFVGNTTAARNFTVKSLNIFAMGM